MKVLNAGAWSRSSERVPVSLPMELEDFIPGVEEFYRKKHNGRKLHWHHIMSNGVVSTTLSSVACGTVYDFCSTVSRVTSYLLFFGPFYSHGCSIFVASDIHCYTQKP